jgi:hypothetical protein
MVSAIAAMLFVVGPTPAQSWGAIKGQIVFSGDKVPTPEKANVDKDQGHCLSKGAIYKNNLVVNEKNKGVRWVLVWITDAKKVDPSFVPPIHPSLKKFKETIEIDQPCCIFEPRVIGIQVGQTLVIKNSAPIPHNFKIDSIGGGPVANPLIPAGGKAEVKGFEPKLLPTVYSCSIHGWMKGWIGTFPHPYFAVTDADGKFEIKNAPAGKFRLMVWHEEPGWVIINPKNLKDRGKVIDIKAGGTTDVGQIPLTVKK